MDFGADSFMLAMAAYNAGEGRVRGALRKGEDPFEERSFWHIVQRGTLQEETNEYVPKILAAMIISENPALFGFPAKKEPNYETISVGSGTSLLLIAELCSTTVDEIRDSNPDLPADAVSTPLAAPRFNLKIPYGFKKMVLAELDKLAGKRNSN
jgi:membrane-bound lytic murein transglycosylase D